MGELFSKDFVCPCDDTGPYTDLEGKVVWVAEPPSKVLDEDFQVEVQTLEGTFSVWTLGSVAIRFPPKVGDNARIRVYRSGGGWYPDNRLMGWSRG